MTDIKRIELNKDKVNLLSIQRTQPQEPVEPIEESAPVITSHEQTEQQSVQQEDSIERRNLISKIQAYGMSRLAKYIKHINIAAVEQKSIVELNDMLREIRYCVGVRSNSRFWWNAFTSGLGAAEHMMVNYTGLHVYGLQQALVQSEEASDLVEEIALKHQSLVFIEPEARLGLLVLQTTLCLHQVNLAREESHKFLNSDVVDTVSKKYAEL